ncbi:hypothetical protein DFJ73DRAFT_964290, partial [Zopfochytrium polystomum]
MTDFDQWVPVVHAFLEDAGAKKTAQALRAELGKHGANREITNRKALKASLIDFFKKNFPQPAAKQGKVDSMDVDEESEDDDGEESSSEEESEEENAAPKPTVAPAKEEESSDESDDEESSSEEESDDEPRVFPMRMGESSDEDSSSD